MHRIKDSRRILTVLLVLVMTMTGCGSIRLIAPYDQKIDDGVTNLQKATAEFFTGIERQGGSTPTDYQNHTRFYDYCKVSLSGLIVRADALTANSLTLQQLEILRQQFQSLEADDQKMGIPQAAVPQYEKAFNRTFTAILTLEVAKKERKTEGAGE